MKFTSDNLKPTGSVEHMFQASFLALYLTAGEVIAYAANFAKDLIRCRCHKKLATV